VIDILEPDEGIFVGNTSNGYVFILSENRQSASYPPRPFRINVGAVHQYILLGEKTSYLSDLKPGSKIPVCKDGGIREVAIGRMKIEKRPFIRLVCKGEGAEISATVQNAESVCFMEEKRGVVSIKELHVGDKVRCFKDIAGRHLGERLDEYIYEV